jgi:ABC-type branched-subunit amino acid transport system ATPase component/branched-subunit amino acid ABC-type transport system permease component
VLPFIVAGLTTGSIYALAAVGLVLTYKTSGIFNFAHGAQASASAFLFYFLRDEHAVPWPVAAVVCVFIAGPCIGLLLEFIARDVGRAPLAMKVLATVGVMLTIQGVINLLYPPGPDREVPQFLPQQSINLGGTPVQVYQLIIFGIGVLGVAALTVFLRYARSGLAMRAVVDNTELLDITGTSPTQVRRLAWVLGSVTASVSGVLLAPLLPLDSTTLTLLVVTAFGAAAVGAFSNLPLTYVGGLAIGVGQSLLQKYFVASTGITGGLASSLPFILLFILLLAAPRLRRPSALAGIRRSASAWHPPWTVQMSGVLVLTAVLMIAPQFAGVHLVDWTSFLAYIVLFLSLGLLVRLSGQVSLAQISFMAIGVCAFSDVAAGHHWPWLLALLFAMVVAAPIGAVLAIPAIRFPGLYLALATFGFGIVLSQMFYGQSYMFGTLGIPVNVPRPHLSWLDLDSDKGYYYFVLAVTVLITIFVVVLERSRLGRLLRAMSDSPVGLRASGTSINVCRVLVFCLAASLAAVAGVLDAGSIGLAGATGYVDTQSLLLFAVIMLSLGRAPWYGILAAASLVLVPSYISASAVVTYALSLFFGVNAIAFSMHRSSRRPGVPAPLRRFADQFRPAADRFRPVPVRAAVAPTAPGQPAEAVPRPRPEADPAADRGLAVDSLTVRFGGLVAVDKVRLNAPPGRITGLIGPNGAGKSTIINSCCGLVRPKSGAVRLHGRPIGLLATSTRARRGLGRTFQQMELFDSMTTRQNVALGREAAFAGCNPLDHVLARRAQRTAVEQSADEAMEICGLADLAEADVGTLSTGQRRLVELARCLAGNYDVLLLDEPSSGLDRAETRRFGGILRRIVEERRVAILLVEHDMALVNSVCDHIYVIDFGKPMFEGTPEETVASPLVRRIYLGTEGEPSTDLVTEVKGA